MLGTEFGGVFAEFGPAFGGVLYVPFSSFDVVFDVPGMALKALFDVHGISSDEVFGVLDISHGGVVGVPGAEFGGVFSTLVSTALFGGRLFPTSVSLTKQFRIAYSFAMAHGLISPIFSNPLIFSNLAAAMNFDQFFLGTSTWPTYINSMISITSSYCTSAKATAITI